MTAGASMLAMTRSRPPQRRQVSMSMAKTRLRRCAQVRDRCQSVADASPHWLSGLAAAARALGTTWGRSGLAGVNLSSPNVAIDTNHLEGTIRPIALGRRNWLYCWTEIGAKCVGILQSLITTCRLHQI